MAGRLAAALLLAVTVVSCGRSPLPARLAELPRSRVWTGQRATRLATRLFGNELQPRDSIVAEYGSPDRLRVWLARFKDGVQAHRALQHVLTDLQGTGSPFSTPRESNADPGRWVTVGPGGHNALWVSHRSIYWVSGDPSLVARVFAQLPPPTRGTLM